MPAETWLKSGMNDTLDPEPCARTDTHKHTHKDTRKDTHKHTHKHTHTSTHTTHRSTAAARTSRASDSASTPRTSGRLQRAVQGEAAPARPLAWERSRPGHLDSPAAEPSPACAFPTDSFLPWRQTRGAKRLARRLKTRVLCPICLNPHRGRCWWQATSSNTRTRARPFSKGPRHTNFSCSGRLSERRALTRVSLSLDGLMRRRRACSEATMFLEFHFQGSDVLLGCWQVSRSFTMLLDAGRQSEVFSVLGVSRVQDLEGACTGDGQAARAHRAALHAIRQGRRGRETAANVRGLIGATCAGP